MNSRARKLAVVASVAFAIGAPSAQALGGWGQSASEFAAAGAGTLRAAGYAFSIWSLLYLGMLAFAIYQFLPAGDRSAAVRRAGWPGAMAMASCGAWILASAFDLEWTSVGIILLALGASVIAMAGAQRSGGSAADRVVVAGTFGALAGWLTIASAVNIITVLTELGWLAPAARVPAAVGGLLAVLAVALVVLARVRLWIYALPVAWGLVAVFVAERGDNPIAAWTALATACVTLLAAGTVLRRST